jgi:serine/threonine protein kinase
MSPEYAAFGEFSTKSDVFSFGVILLEIVSGKKNNHSYQEHSSLTLIGHVSNRKIEYFPFAFYETRTPFTDNAIYDRTTQVWELWRADRVLDIVDSCIDVESYVSHEALRCIQIGLLCVQEDVMDRPTMSEVVLMLSSDTALPSPKQPAFIFRRPSKDLDSVAEEGPHSVNEVTITKVEAQ